MPPALIVCPGCACHAKSTEVVCPSCGEPLRRIDGSIPRTAVAVLLGLTAAAASCSSTGGSGTAVHYGLALTSSASSGGTGGFAAHYGIAATGSSSSSGGTGGAGGATASSSGSGGKDGG